MQFVAVLVKVFCVRVDLKLGLRLEGNSSVHAAAAMLVGCFLSSSAYHGYSETMLPGTSKTVSISKYL